MSVWTVLTTGAAAGIIGWGAKWAQSWVDATNQRRNAMEDQVRQHVAGFVPKYDLMSNHAYLLASALVAYLQNKMEVQLTADTTDAKASLDDASERTAQDSLFYAAKFYRGVCKLFWVDGAKYYLPVSQAEDTLKNLHNEIMARLPLRPEKVFPFLEDGTMVHDFAVIVEQAKNATDVASKGLLIQIQDFRAWMKTNDRQVRELAGYAAVYAEAFEQQLNAAWAQRGIFGGRNDGSANPTFQDNSFSTFGRATDLIQAAEADRQVQRKLWTDLIGRHKLEFYEQFCRGWDFYAAQDYAAALVQYRLALESNPDHSETLNNIANVYARQKRYGDAESYFRKALSGPGVEDGRKATYQMNWGAMWKARAAEEGQAAEGSRSARLQAIEHLREATNLSASNYLLWNELGNSYYDDEQWEQAEAAYRTAGEIVPNNPVVHANWAAALVKVGRLDKTKLDAAVQHLQQAIANTPVGERGKEPEKAGYFTSIAEVFEIKGDLLSARSFRTKAAEADTANSRNVYQLQNVCNRMGSTLALEDFNALSGPFASSGKPSDRYWLGLAFFLRKDYLAALEQFSIALNVEPENAAYHFELGKTRWRLGLPDLAARSYQKAVNLSSKNSAYLRSLGLALHAAGAYDDALEPLARSLEVNPRDIDCLLATALCQAYGSEHSLEKALATCERALSVDKGDSRIYECKAQLQRGNGLYAEAMDTLKYAIGQCTDPAMQQTLLNAWRDLCDEALKQHDSNPSLLSESGEIYSRLNRVDEALTAYDKAAALGPLDPQATLRSYKLRGDRCYRRAFSAEQGDNEQQQQYRDAIANWEKALEHEVAASEKARLLNNIGTAYDGLQQNKDALDRYWQASRIEPESPVVHYNLALALYRLNALPRALAEFEESSRLKPQLKQPFYQMGNCYYRMGRSDLAQPNWAKACDLDPEYAEAISNLGVLAYEQGDSAGARERWEKACKIDPGLSPTAKMLASVLAGAMPDPQICESSPQRSVPPREASNLPNTSGSALATAL